jgi:hypothetical protein
VPANAAFDCDEIAPWTEPDRTEAALDAAYRGGILEPGQRWASDFTYRPIPPADSLTILRVLHGRVLAKRIEPGVILDYDQAARFDMVRCFVRNLDDLEIQLRWLAGQTDRCIMRGDIVGEHYRVRDVPRLLHARDGQPATLIEKPRRWVAIDIDEPPPEPVRCGDLIGAASVGATMLPPEFRGCHCITQATASHGFKPGLRVRLWFWLSRPMTTAELKFWFRTTPVDPSVFGANQIIYTAAPIFAHGAVDPVRERLVHVSGSPVVEVPPPEKLRASTPMPPKPRISVKGLSPRAKAILDRAETVILGAPKGRQEITLVRRSYAVGCAVADGKLPEALARNVLIHIGRQLPALDPESWTAREVDEKILRAFTAGIQAVSHG